MLCSWSWPWTGQSLCHSSQIYVLGLHLASKRIFFFFKNSTEHSLCMRFFMFPWLVLLQSSGFYCCCSHPNPLARPLKAPVYSLSPILLPCTIPSIVTSFSVSYCKVICSTPGLNCMDDFESPFLSSPYYTLGTYFHPVSIPRLLIRLCTIVDCKKNGGLNKMISLCSTVTWWLVLWSFSKYTFGCFCAYTLKVGQVAGLVFSRHGLIVHC